MDYDDNEFQGQNCHVGGEGSSKFSPVLHPYALSKFDFDDGLQGHLRFDSLVENEVFLGIQGQEDSQWIEDFSRGSGVYTSSAPEPCPILRSDNVWSEAASSESVEMLLKSVGQEETANITEKSDACQKLGCVAEKMESHFKEDDNTMEILNSKPALCLEKSADHGSGLIDVEGVSNSPGVEISTHERSGMLIPNALGEPYGVCGSEDNLDGQNGEEIVSEVDASLEKIPVNEMQDPSGSNMHTEDEYAMSPDTFVNPDGLDNQESVVRVTDVGFDSARCLLTGSGNEVEENIISEEVHVGGQCLKEISSERSSENLINLSCSSSNSKVVELCPVKINVSKLDEPSSFSAIGSSDLHIAEECDENVRALKVNMRSECDENVRTLKLNVGSECDHVDSSDMTQIHQQFEENIQDNLPKDFQGDGDFVDHVVKVTEKVEISAGSEPKMSPRTEVTDSLEERKVLMQLSVCQLGTGVSVSHNRVPALSSLNNEVSDAQRDGTSLSSAVEDTVVTSTCDPTPIREGEHLIEKSKLGDDASGICKGSNAEDRVSSPIVSGVAAALASDLNSVHHDQVVSSNGEEKPIFPNDTSEMECHVVERLDHEKQIELSFNGESGNVNNEAVCGSECDAVTSMEPDVTADTGVTHDDLSVDQMRENPATGIEGSIETNIVLLKETSQSSDKMDPVLEIEKGSASNYIEDLSQKAAADSLPVGGTLNATSESEQAVVIMNVTASQSCTVAEITDTAIQAGQAEKKHQISESSSSKLVLFPSTCDQTTKQKSDADASDTPADHGVVGKDRRLAPSEVSDCDVPTLTIRGNVLNGSKSENEETVDKSLVKSVQPAGTLESAFKVAKQSDAAKDDRSFTFDAHLLGIGDCGQVKQFCPATQSSKSYEEASASPIVVPMEPKAVLLPSHVSSQALDLEIGHGGLTGTTARKRRQASGRAPGKQSAKKRNSLIETTPSGPLERGDNKSSMTTGLSGSGQLQFEAVKLHEKFEHSIVPYAGVAVGMPNLPDLNTSASPSAVFRQPFSDIQQMQLRAQIFVYGSLIQGAAPDETCMLAAFGSSDGGRNMWEPVWRACVKRLQSANSNLSKYDNTLQPQSGPKPPEQTSTKKDALQSTVLPSPVGRASSKGTPSPVVNSMIPLSSPLWNVSTPLHALQSTGMPISGAFDPRQTILPFHPFQTPTSRSVAGNNSPWPSHASVSAPRINASQSSPFDGSARLPVNETVKLTPIKESVPPIASGSKHSFPSITARHSSISVSAEPYPLPDVEKTTLPSGHKTAEPKPRKRKKSSASENLIQFPLLAQPRTELLPVPLPLFGQAQTDCVPALVPFFTQARTELVSAPVPAPVVPSHLSTSVIVSTPPFFGSKGYDGRTVGTASPSYMADPPKRVEPIVERKSNLPEDALVKAEVAKQQAEDAAALSTAAVSHSQTIWDQLNKQKNFGVLPEVEAKLASAAVAVAAAAAVAKAAAAAAQVASDAASQAKMMADEAWIFSRVSNPAFNNPSFITNEGNSMGCATTSSSILKVADEKFSSSILVAAKEAAKKRVEAASFASKRAENLDAIVKAAELAAAAVSQAGRIVAMGDPPSLAKLVEAGPEGYWKLPQVLQVQPNVECSNVDSIQATPDVSGRHVNDEPSKKKAKTASRGMSPLSREVFKDSVDGVSSFFASSEKDSGAQDSRTCDLDRTIGVVPESESGSRLTSIAARDDCTDGIETWKGTSIKEGSLVEVKKEGYGFKEAWFSANVLNIEGGKAFVSYATMKSGSTQLKEWVALEDGGNNAPRIRVSPPVMGIQYEGTRKRRRGAIGDHVWSVGDKVDVRIKECWREGVITEKNKVDGTTITVHFPAEGETSVVRAWHLRPTLIWKDGKWIESSSSRQRDPSHKGDTPQEKRLKLGGVAIDGSKKDNLSKTFQLPEPERPEEQQLLPLSDNEKKFNVGNNIKNDNELDAPRTVRSGLQKEGPRVVFGVPKPVKKKKYMEVSKHYVSEGSNKTDKLKGKYMMPKNEAKEKQQGDLITKVPKPGKPISSFGRTLSQKDKFLRSAAPNKNEKKKSASTDGIESEQQKQSDFGTVSCSDEAAQGSFVFSSSALSRNMFTSNARLERTKRGNRAPIVSKATKEMKNNLDAGKEIPEISEPRRSNRRIQPTSRLLEGLQSSLILPKFPSFAHDKGQRSHNRSTLKGKQ